MQFFFLFFHNVYFLGRQIFGTGMLGEQNAYVKNPVICVLNLGPNTIEVFDLAEMGAATFSPYKV